MPQYTGYDRKFALGTGKYQLAEFLSRKIEIAPEILAGVFNPN